MQLGKAAVYENHLDKEWETFKYQSIHKLNCFNVEVAGYKENEWFLQTQFLKHTT